MKKLNLRKLNLKKKQAEPESQFSQYDHDPLAREASKRKKIRHRKWLRVLCFFVAAGLIGYYLYSDYSKVGTITIKNNDLVSESAILDALDIDSTEYNLLITKSSIEDQIEAIPGIKSVKVKKGLFPGITITVTEEKILGYTYENGSYSILFGDGTIGPLNNDDFISTLTTYPQVHDFGDYLSEFANKYAQVSESIRSQFSDIYFTNDAADPKRISIYTNDHKTVIVRLDDMLDQLTKYNQTISQCPGYSTYDFLGSYVYMK